MASFASSERSVITASVAGDENTRRLRACIAQATCPNLDNRFATAGAVAFNPGAGVGVPPPLEMTGAKKEVVSEKPLPIGWRFEDKIIPPQCFSTLWMSGDNYEEFYEN